ncbi:hypothetical protein BN12_1450005 [Nostocoides japonicum T1-X7]|uniref:Uncharacterized protein n=1 Tax=Nostocoides japonicum T1-X7 TaxID=1194083 RepID=A0A077LVE8_9MICO|nr:hypothetical protein BN12_1450005 [Tetrasphaera japonica T1-X7]
MVQVSASRVSFVFLPADSGFSWDATPALLRRVLVAAEVTEEPAMAVSEDGAVPLCARWLDGDELWFFLTRDAREFADEVLASMEVSEAVRERLAGVAATCDLRIEISSDGDSDTEDGEGHLEDWMLATEALAELPGAVDVDGGFLAEATPRR